MRPESPRSFRRCLVQLATAVTPSGAEVSSVALMINPSRRIPGNLVLLPWDSAREALYLLKALQTELCGKDARFFRNLKQKASSILRVNWSSIPPRHTRV